MSLFYLKKHRVHLDTAAVEIHTPVVALAVPSQFGPATYRLGTADSTPTAGSRGSQCLNFGFHDSQGLRLGLHFFALRGFQSVESSATSKRLRLDLALVERGLVESPEGRRNVA